MSEETTNQSILDESRTIAETVYTQRRPTL